MKPRDPKTLCGTNNAGRNRLGSRIAGLPAVRGIAVLGFVAKTLLPCGKMTEERGFVVEYNASRL